MERDPPERDDPWGDDEPPVLERLRREGPIDGPPFRDRALIPWAATGATLLLAVAVIPVFWPETGRVMEEAAIVLALFFLIAAIGSWFRMKARAFVVAAAIVALLYAGTALSSLQLEDLFLPAILVGFLLFLLAGFNLVFVLEEIVYDAHRLLPLRGRFWGAVPPIVLAAAAAALQLGRHSWAMPLGSLRVAVFVACGVLIASWVLRAVLRGGGRHMTREVHLLIAGGVAGVGLVDVVGFLRGPGGLLPTLVAFFAVVGTWIYISFTTLQRAQYFLRADDALPWLGLLLSSSFAVLSHVHGEARLGGGAALVDVVDLRISYMVVGVWVGMAFFLLRGFWRLLEYLRQEDRLGGRVRRFAAQAARLLEQAWGTGHGVQLVAFRLYQGVERTLPGPHVDAAKPEPRVLDLGEGAPVPREPQRKTGEPSVAAAHTDDGEE